jgi:predicted glycosyltransferase involved in capsule biosynthesis
MKNFISLNIHTHNRDRFLEKTLLSLEKQDYKKFEVNICETANMVSTIEIIKRFSKKIQINCWQLHLKFVDRTRILNFLLENSSGDIVAIADTDVLKRKDYFSEINEKITLNSFLIQYVKYLDEKNTLKILKDNRGFDDAALFAEKIELNSGAKSQICVFKEKINAIGGYDADNFFGWGYEDSDLFARLQMSGLQPVALSSFGVHLFHKRTWEFHGFRKEELNLKAHYRNLETKNIIAKNSKNIRRENQWDQTIDNPIKISL